MDFTVGVLLGTFLMSIAALFLFVWSMAKGLFGDGSAAATEIFAPGGSRVGQYFSSAIVHAHLVKKKDGRKRRKKDIVKNSVSHAVPLPQLFVVAPAIPMQGFVIARRLFCPAAPGFHQAPFLVLGTDCFWAGRHLK